MALSRLHIKAVSFTGEIHLIILQKRHTTSDTVTVAVSLLEIKTTQQLTLEKGFQQSSFRLGPAYSNFARIFSWPFRTLQFRTWPRPFLVLC